MYHAHTYTKQNSQKRLFQGEVRRLTSVSRDAGLNQTTLGLSAPLEYAHVAGVEMMYGTRRIRTRARVGLLTRNIVIRGEGQGEDVPYTLWNAPGPFKDSLQVCMYFQSLCVCVCL